MKKTPLFGTLMSDADGTCDYVLDPDDPETWGAQEGDVCHVDEEVLNEDGVWTCPHDAEEGEDRCIFHLPIEEKENDYVVDSLLNNINEVTTDTSKSEEGLLQFLGLRIRSLVFDCDIELPENIGINFSHSTIYENFDFSDIVLSTSHLDLSGVQFLSDATFECSIICGTVSFLGAEFRSSGNFERVEFRNNVGFRFASIKDTISFTGASFIKSANFERTEFEGFVSFKESEFNGSVGFSSVVFHADVNMINSRFDRYARFVGSTFEEFFATKHALFNGKADFSQVEFEYKVSFRSTTFENAVDLRWANFHKTVSFSNSTFEGAVDSRWAQFDSNAIFDKTEFRDTADFQEITCNGSCNFTTKFANSVDFSDAEFTHSVDFSDTNFMRDVSFARAVFETSIPEDDDGVFWDASFEFLSIQFNGDADFSDSTFAGNTRFQDSDFDGDANFSRVTFQSNISYVGVTINGRADFSRSDFDPDKKSIEINFGGIHFNNTAHFNGVRLQGPNFTNAVFDGPVKFIGECVFENETNFDNAMFNKNASFSAHFDERVVFNSADFRGDADFSGSHFSTTSDFRDANLIGASFIDVGVRDANFEDAQLENTDFRGADISKSNLERATLSNSDMFGTDLSGAQLYGANIADVAVNTETVFDKCREHRCVYDPNSDYEYESDDEEQVGQLRKAMGAYHVLEQLTRANTLPDEQAKFFARRQDMRRAQLREDGRRLEYWFAEAQNAIFRHGESFSRVAAWAVGTIVGFGLLYPIGGWLQSESTGTITYSNIADSPLLLWKSLHHSALLFLTGSGPLAPTGAVGEVLVTIEAITAPVLLALLVFVLGRRAAR
uniref:Pentapeptide repeat-containing protein n=1 Tax=uncultured haloarchaeon TaxID=160804 RepID=A5YS61_9EURY|nr:hypothetical protein [uncultured haloarchaeon]